jgi:hypothetical protein
MTVLVGHGSSIERFVLIGVLHTSVNETYYRRLKRQGKYCGTNYLLDFATVFLRFIAAVV